MTAEDNTNKTLENLLDIISYKTNMDKAWYTAPPRELFEKTVIETGLLKAIRGEWTTIIKRVNKERPRVFLHCDYDVDGVTSIEIVLRALKKKYSWDENVLPFFPDRKNGYGITKTSIAHIKKYKPDIIFTVDCGTNDVLLRKYAAEHPETEIFVLDHHIIAPGNEIVPDNFHLINAHLYQANLSAGGLSFCFALVIVNRSIYNSDEIGFAGLSTVADQVDLSHPENYALTKLSLQFLNAQVPDWAYRLSQTKQFTSTTLGFQIGPRINAISRTGKSPSIAAKALRGDIDAINELNKANAERQNDIESLFVKYMSEVIVSEADVIFLSLDEGTKHGYLGLLASKVAEIVNKPVLICSGENGVYSGSARGVKGIHLVNDVLNPAKEFFIKFGGHAGAAGFSFEESSKSKLEEFFNTFKIVSPTQEDDSIVLPDFSANFVQSAAYATFLSEPHGNGNPEPIFRVNDCEIVDVIPLKDGQYTSFLVAKDRKTLKFPFWEKYDVTYDAVRKVFCFHGGISEPLNVRFRARYSEQTNFPYSYDLVDFSSTDGEKSFSKKYIKSLLAESK